MRLIPDPPYNFPSKAEEKVFGLLKECCPDGYALHSINISSHRWKPWTEIDFVCVTAFGLLALEVKGGAISRHGGHWFTNGKPLKESPFDQVRAATFELIKEIDLKGASFGWAVVMPDSDSVPTTSEHPREMQAVYSDCASPRAFARWIASLEQYWSAKRSNYRTIDSRLQSDLVRQMRPNFDAAVPLGRQAKLLNEQILQFTEEQFLRLDEYAENDRILCRGGAGTGKTFLGVEVAKRESAIGRKVLVVARSKPLVEWIRKRLDLPGVTVCAADDLPGPQATDDLFDVLIVDEGQDLLSLKYLDRLDGLLNGGLTDGRWRWFMDDQQQSGFHNDVDSTAIQLIDTRGVTRQKLRMNCRNTKQITEFTQFTTGADIGEAKLRGGGKEPEFRFVTAETELDILNSQLRSWHRDHEVAYGRMAVLVCRPDDVPRVRDAVDRQVRVESVRDFKGLEAEFVALVGIPGEPGVLEQMRAAIYTGLTRARIELWVAVPESIRGEWTLTHTENARRKVNMELGINK